MASTYSWNDLITYVSQSNPRLQADAAGALLCDMLQSYIWSKADWRFSLKTLPPFYLVGGQQDYVAPSVTIPDDFLGLRSALLVYNGTEPATTYPPLKVLRYLQKTYAMSRPTSLCYQADIGGFRIYPRCPNGIGVMDYQIEGTYKKKPVKITTNTLMSVMPWDDLYMPTAVEGLKYFIKPAAQQSDKDLQRFLNMIDDMAAREATNLGDQPLAPNEPLVGW